MTIHEKLSHLTRWANRAQVCRLAGLDKGYLASVLSQKHDLSTRAVRGLARVLSVDPGWLIDDSRGWPPVRVEPGLAEIQELEEARTVA